MLGSAGRSEFFAREASDYLRALEPLLEEAPPEGDHFVRLARALRGAAMLAGPASFTRAASQLEQIARRSLEPSFPWASAVSRLREAHAVFTRLAGRATSWDGELDKEADDLGARLGEIITSPSAPSIAPVTRPPAQTDQSIRQFVGREAAAVAASLRDAAHALSESGAPPLDRLRRVSESMHSLRGLAGVSELAPLADLLDATDTAVRELLRYPTLPPGAAELCLCGAEAFGRIAGDVATRGRTDPELPEAHRFADQLRQVLSGPEAVVPIDDLDGGSALLKRAEPRFAEPLDISSLGERMRAGADQLRGAPSRAAGRLHALVLLALLRDAPGGLGRRPAGPFLARICDALDAASSQGDPPSLAGLLEDAGRLLADGAGADLAALEQALDALGEAADVVPMETLLAEEAIVDIITLAPDAARPALDLPADRTALERSLSHYSRLVREDAPISEPPPVAIEALAPDPEPEPVPIEVLAPDPVAATLVEQLEPVVAIEDLEPDPEPVPIAALAPDEELPLVTIDQLAPEPELVPLIRSLAPEPLPTDGSVVPIGDLLYHGSGAMARADEVRRLLEVSLQMASTELDRVEPLVRELLDLVPLALVGTD
jgi:hypothetical protein